MKKVISQKINKPYWYSETETEEVSREGYPVFTKHDFDEIRRCQVTSNSLLLKIWILRCDEKISIMDCLSKIAESEKETHMDQYNKADAPLVFSSPPEPLTVGLSESAKNALSNIKAALTAKESNARTQRSA